MKPLIELKDVNKIYDMGETKLQVLKSISLKISRGDDLAIIGASGSGKSTMLNMIGCLDRPTSGKVLIDGRDVSKLSDNEVAMIRGNKIGFVFQFFYLLPNLTALENVELPAIFTKKEKSREKAKRILKLVGLENRMNHYPKQLSGGEQQRVAIARALINDPEIVLADEPTGNLDTKSGRDIMNILRKLNKERKELTIIVITHDQHIAGMFKRKLYLRDGQIIKRVSA